MACEKQPINQPREKKEMCRGEVGIVPFFTAGERAKSFWKHDAPFL